MKCPECLEEVMEGEPNCLNCGANLVDEVDGEFEEERGLISILTASDDSEAYVIKELLEGNGIPVFIRSNNGFQTRGDFDYGMDTWGELLVNKVDAENSISFIQKYMDIQRDLLIQREEAEYDESFR